MMIEVDDEFADSIVAQSLSNWIIDLLEDNDTAANPDRWDMIANLYCALQYYITHEQMVEFMREYPELAEELDWSEDD